MLSFILFLGALFQAGAQPLRAETMVYVANADSHEIGVLTLDEATGHLKPVQSVAVGGKAMPIAISPDRRLMYVGLRSEPYSVATLSIDQATGRLTLLGTVPLAADMAYLSVDRTGRFLFGASYFGDLISVNPISQRGWVQPRPAAVMQTRPKAHAILPDPSNRWVFATNLGGDIILQYAFDEAQHAGRQ